MVKYHILTPFSRGQNMKKILKNFGRLNVVFHPIINDHFDFPKEGWIKPFTFVLEPSVKKQSYYRVYYYALNKFLDSKTLVDNDYYMFLSDDDFLEPTFFKKIEGINSDFIIVSMKRGDNMPKGTRYGTRTLGASWKVMGKRGIGGEQIIVKGKILKNERFRKNIIGDGWFIRKMWKRHPHKNFTFVKDAYVWFNYLEPGRWDEKAIPKHRNTE